MSDDPGGLASRLLNICVTVLVAAMALYGAVYILREIWVPLCITLATVVIVGGGGALVYRRFRGW
ncbi:hypothetical protein Gbro_1438 [Gordonia bronchialis DSM 43247]|uniref:Uncharacterized protein n=1 Tax=Gordonia bronchialis (strain ATCC 25592 / DSM 43247 / BCRC 13721 / JCM 3198 / KCTC 3076 / NBRC 16047 / NCTC 10667) TaxID=526226 RepID=D0L6G3_GORB4|nr:hypothetical protein [Gordonia bronchialis]ACY20720.1 hypothetical protein Gbro_1438 [Gordonia bronchialis DSM 43247]MCC3323493.1 hypothetical protein [Gordonia bronchialis]QGS25529.1 hypothetical protein FOB84_16685 [Gordonia bronchialis]STQ63549.1 Uncharacterised protein [Gordonia bronchialis]